MPALSEHVSLGHASGSHALLSRPHKGTAVDAFSDETSTLCESLALLGFFHSDPSIAVPDTERVLVFRKDSNQGESC